MSQSLRHASKIVVGALLLAGSYADVHAAAQAIITQEAPVSATSRGLNEQVSSDYVIGPEDVLGILVWREEEMSGDVTVRSDGMITIPLVGDLTAAGLRPKELARQIETLSAVYLSAPNVTVIAREINSRKAFITGEVARSGAYSLSGPLTVIQLIALSGGLVEWADRKNITIMRIDDEGRTQLIEFNYERVEEGRELEQNILLQPGDTVVVP